MYKIIVLPEMFPEVLHRKLGLGTEHDKISFTYAWVHKYNKYFMYMQQNTYMDVF